MTLNGNETDILFMTQMGINMRLANDLMGYSLTRLKVRSCLCIAKKKAFFNITEGF